MGIPRSWSGDGAQVESGGALGPEKLRRDFDHGFLTTVLIYFYCCIFMLLFVHFTTVIQTKWKTSIGLKNSAMSYHLRPIWSLVKIILNVTLYEAIASIIVKPVLGMHESTVSWI